MARNNYAAGKRQREADKARDRQEKAERRNRNRERGGGSSIPIASADDIQGGEMRSIDEVVRALGEAPDPSAKPRSHSVPGRLFVGGLAHGVTEAQVRAKFEELGPVDEAFIVADRDTGESRNFGFVTMSDRRDAAEAIRRLDGQDFEGRSLVVRMATERPR
jgi:RNA recognition motif-containing protein